MATRRVQTVVEVALHRHGRTLAEEAGITLRDTPAPLWQLLVLSLLLSARIRSSIAVTTARELFRDGCRTPADTAGTTWQQRVDALGRGGYRRYDERTSTQLGELAQRVLGDHGGDLRRMRDRAGSVRSLEESLRSFTGIGPAGAAIFCREVQGVWPQVAPYVDDLVAEGARRLGLPDSPAGLSGLVPPEDLPRLAAACVRAARDEAVVDDVRTATAGRNDA